MRELTGVVLPNAPTFDKIAAFAVLRLAKPDLPVVDFWKSNQNPSPEVMAAWDAQGVVAIDVGDQKYHRIGCGSALEAVIKKFGLPTNAALTELVRLVNENNRTGFLKDAPSSIVWILREAYKLGRDQREVVDRVCHVVHTWLEVFGHKSRAKPFTVDEYVSNLRHLGVPESEIPARRFYFLHIQDEAWLRKDQAELAWDGPDQFWTEFTLSKGGRAVWVETEDDQYLGRAAFTVLRGLKLICLRSSKGNVVIETRGLTLSSLARVLSAEEPGRWFYDSRIEALLNGTFSLSEIPPTGKSKEEIIRLACTLAAPKQFRKR